jgi:hypothetical protein
VKNASQWEIRIAAGVRWKISLYFERYHERSFLFLFTIGVLFDLNAEIATSPSGG